MNASDVFGFADALGPARIIHVYEPSAGLKGILVVDNVARGPAIGGLRMAPDVSVAECFRLARAMTFKNAAAGLPHGGAKSVIFGDPKMPGPDKERLIRAFASSLRNERDYIFAPDMGTDENCMAWVKDEIGRAAGFPSDLGGIPLDEVGATGWGIYQATEIAARYCNMKIDGARVVIQGFGAVGRHSARFLAQAGAVLVGASDSRGAVYNPRGLDVSALMELKKTGKSVSDVTAGEKRDRDAVIDMECDIWIPAARPDVINAANASRLNTKLIVEGANIPVTPEAEKFLHEHDVLCVPDFIANAGGVICAALEYRGVTQAMVFSSIGEKVRSNTEQILEAVSTKAILPRHAALELAEQRVKKAMSYRRWSLFSSADDNPRSGS
jgi:glutamate dehydrogenase (NAD(P)+)